MRQIMQLLYNMRFTLRGCLETENLII